MKIEFAVEINEYSDGPGFIVQNTGKPIEVSTATGETLLRAKVPPPGNPHAPLTEWVNVFQIVGVSKKEAKEANFIDTYPNGFPHAKELAAAGFAHPDAILLSREQLEELSLKGVGPKGLDSIMKFHTGA